VPLEPADRVQLESACEASNPVRVYPHLLQSLPRRLEEEVFDPLWEGVADGRVIRFQEL
jgi:hypothetical protein